MCKFNPKNDSRRIDPCLKEFISNFYVMIEDIYTIKACCCGHGKYPMTIIIDDGTDEMVEIVSGKIIPRKKKFYKKDKQGVYYIPEVMEKKK